MKVNQQRRWRIIRGYTVGWIAAFIFLAIVRGSGTIEEGSAEFGEATSLALATIFGLVFGGIAGVAQVLIEERLYRRVSLGKLLAARLLAAVAFLVLINLAGYLLVTSTTDVAIGYVEFSIEPGSFAILLYILVVDTFLVGLRQVNLLLGEGNLWKLIRGAFYSPSEEERIFMFLDLRSSTTLAEELGHVKYSKFIQDCFDDLGVVSEHNAEIYQYVGDGVILTWSLRDGLKDQSCLTAYYRFRDRLLERSDHYQARYQNLPVFTAGANAGVVTVTEVGKFKKDIAFHGDTVNTAARIQGQCKVFGEDLLISDTLRDQLNAEDHLFTPLGRFPLRGKEAEVPIFAVSRAS